MGADESGRDFNTIGRNYDCKPAPSPAGDGGLKGDTALSYSARGTCALGGKAFSAFGAPGIDHGTAVFRSHASTKSMGALAMQVAGLVSSFHSGYRVLKR